MRVIAGQVGPQAGPGSTHTPMALVHATIEPGARLELPWNHEFNGLVHVPHVDGTIGQAIAWAGPFVMNTKAEVLQAYEDFQKGNFGHIPG